MMSTTAKKRKILVPRLCAFQDACRNPKQCKFVHLKSQDMILEVIKEELSKLNKAVTKSIDKFLNQSKTCSCVAHDPLANTEDEGHVKVNDLCLLEENSSKDETKSCDPSRQVGETHKDMYQYITDMETSLLRDTSEEDNYLEDQVERDYLVTSLPIDDSELNVQLLTDAKEKKTNVLKNLIN